MAHPSCTPFFFGPPGDQLFGLLHDPATAADRPAGVILSNPFGHEQVRAHRAFKLLGEMLCRAGFFVLRFDYRGSGDSAGDGLDVRLMQWREDLGHAVDEVKRRSGVPRVAVIGLRLGATLAALEASGRDDVETLVLWDPVLNGRTYVRQLLELDRKWREALARRAGSHADDDSLLLGFPLPPSLRADIESVDETVLDHLRVGQLVVLVSDPDRTPDSSRLVIERHGPSVWRAAPAAVEWDTVESVHQTLLPHATLQSISACLADPV